MNKPTILKSIGVLICLFLFSTTHAQLAQSDKTLVGNITSEVKTENNERNRSFVATAPPTGNPISIGEFERAAGVIVAYPFGIPMSLIKEMAKDVLVYTIVSNNSQQSTVKNIYQQNGVNIDNCRFFIAPTDSYWTRDYSPWFISYGDNQIGVVDFPYNRPRPNDDEIPKVVANALGINWFGMDVVQTGGNYMTDGYGIASSSHIAYTENPGISHSEVDDRMKKYLGITKYHVVQDPNNTYIDHIDCWGKFLAPDKVLIRAVPTSHPQYNKLEQTAAYFASAMSGYGHPYKVYRVNTPQNQPYTNSLILNDKVFVPITGSSSDEAALQAYRDAMPGYKVFGIQQNPSTPWESTDALHCRTHEMADLGWLRIKHIPFADSVDSNADTSITAEVIPHSGQEVYPDSVFCYYRVNAATTDEYDHVVMTKTTGNTYTTTLANVPEGYRVEYYLFAADKSGRREFHPFIGKNDPHLFWKGELKTAEAEISQTVLNCEVEEGNSIDNIIKLTNNGGAELNYKTEIEYLDNQKYNWLSLDEPNGTVASNSVENIKISCNSESLEKGEYRANIYFRTNDLTNETIKVEVKLTVTMNSAIDNVEYANRQIKASPNPFKDNLEIHFTIKNADKYSLTIYNSLGIVVYQAEPKEHYQGEYNMLIDTQNFAPGLYTVVLKGAKVKESVKVIKQ